MQNIILISIPGGRVNIEEMRIPLFLITLQRPGSSAVLPRDVDDQHIGHHSTQH